MEDIQSKMQEAIKEEYSAEKFNQDQSITTAEQSVENEE